MNKTIDETFVCCTYHRSKFVDFTYRSSLYVAQYRSIFVTKFGVEIEVSVRIGSKGKLWN